MLAVRTEIQQQQQEHHHQGVTMADNSKSYPEDQSRNLPPPSQGQRPSDPIISAKKLPKKRKFDPSELEENDKIGDCNVVMQVNKISQPILHQSRLPIQQCQRNSPKIDEPYQVKRKKHDNVRFFSRKTDFQLFYEVKFVFLKFKLIIIWVNHGIFY